MHLRSADINLGIDIMRLDGSHRLYLRNLHTDMDEE